MTVTVNSSKDKFTLPKMLSFPGKFMGRLVLLLETELPDLDSGCELILEFGKFCTSPAIFKEAATLVFLKLGGGVVLFFSYNKNIR